jgi:hypothetical protein
MSAGQPAFARLLAQLFALAIRLYPDQVRSEYADEMQAVFNLKVADAAQQGGWRLFSLACREARDLPQAITKAHLHADRGGMMQPAFPSTSDQTPWPTALLSLLPFFVAGPLRLILNFQPGWRPEERSLVYFTFLLLSSLLVIGGGFAGAVKKFPRWAYPYPVYLAFSVYALAQYANYLFRWDYRLLNSFFLNLVFILIILSLPGLRWFYRHIPQDWTLVTYSLFGIVLFLLAGIDKDETPQLTLLVLLPSLLTLGAALAHLRISSATTRIAVLLAGTFAALLFWLLPIFQGMITVWAGLAIGLLMLLGYGIILTAILLAPLLVSRAIHFWRASR